MDLGGTEHSFEPGSHPQCTALRANPFAASRLGRVRLLRIRTFGVLSIAGNIVDYGSEGWLWALFGLCQRMYVDSRSVSDVDGPAQSLAPPAPAMKEKGPNATAGLLGRRGRLHLAGTN